MSDSGTIDITEIVNMVKDAWVKWSAEAIFAYVVSIPGLQWLAIPFFKYIFMAIVKKYSTILANTVEMLAFFENTAIRKYAQAGDFVKATNDLNNLPPTTPKDQYEKYEVIRMSAFRNFVLVTN